MSLEAFSDHQGGLKLAWRSVEGASSYVRGLHLQPNGDPHPGWDPCGEAVLLPAHSDDCTYSSTQYFNSAPAWPVGLLAATRYQQGCRGCHGCWWYSSSGLTHITASTSISTGEATATAGTLSSSDWLMMFVFSDEVGGRYLRSDLADMYRDGAGFNPTWSTMLPSNLGAGVTPDARGGFHVLWGSSEGLRATRLENDGLWNPAWDGFGGRVVGASPARAYRHLAAVDELGGAFIAWEDWRNRNESGVGLSEMRATWIRHDGVVGPDWPADGRLFGVQPFEQELSAIVGNRKDAAIVAWRDARAGDWNLYAYRLTSAPAVPRARGQVFPAELEGGAGRAAPA